MLRRDAGQAERGGGVREALLSACLLPSPQRGRQAEDQETKERSGGRVGSSPEASYQTGLRAPSCTWSSPPIAEATASQFWT